MTLFWRDDAACTLVENAELCSDCDRPMLRARKRAGVRTHAANGRCHACYARTRRRDLRGVRGNRGAWGAGADIDEIAVERAMRGYPVELNAPERREVVATLTRRGFSIAEISRRTGLAARSVQRLRSKTKDAA